MYKKGLKYCLLVLVGCISMTVNGQTIAPKYSNDFLNIGVGGRALGMGKVSTAIAKDVTAAYWNPAGLLSLENKYQVALMHSEYFAGIAKYDYGAFATKLDSNSALAVSLIRFGVDDIPDTRDLIDANGAIDYSRVRYFSASDNAMLLSYAKRLEKLKAIQFGVNAKVIYRNAGSFGNAWGFGLDVGFRYEKDGWMAGLLLRDITTTFNFWTINTEAFRDIYTQLNSDDDPTNDQAIPSNSMELTLPRFNVGGAKYFSIKDKFGVMPALDLGISWDGKRNTLIKTSVFSIAPQMGLELNYKKVVYLRGGISNIQEIKDFDGSTSMQWQPNFGVGLAIKRVHMDYALTNATDLSGDGGLFSHVISLRLDIDK